MKRIRKAESSHKEIAAKAKALSNSCDNQRDLSCSGKTAMPPR